MTCRFNINLFKKLFSLSFLCFAFAFKIWTFLNLFWYWRLTHIRKRWLITKFLFYSRVFFLNSFYGCLFLYFAIFRWIYRCIMRFLIFLLNLRDYFFFNHGRKLRSSFLWFNGRIFFFFYVFIWSWCWWFTLNIFRITDRA